MILTVGPNVTNANNGAKLRKTSDKRKNLHAQKLVKNVTTRKRLAKTT